jgi:hypothetical protein
MPVASALCQGVHPLVEFEAMPGPKWPLATSVSVPAPSGPV